MTKKEILEDMLVKYTAYVSDYNNELNWEAYVEAWHNWRAVRGDD